MANLRTNSDLVQNILARSSEPPGTVSEFYSQAVVYYNQVYQSLCSGGNELDPDVDETWWWLRKATPGIVMLQPAFTAGTVALTTGDTTATFSAPPTDSSGTPIGVQGWFLQPDAQQGAVYQVSSHTVGNAVATLDSPYAGQAATSSQHKTYKLEYTLAADCKEVIGPMRTQYDTPREISASEKVAMRRHYPIGRQDPDIPRLFAPVSEANSVLTVQFSNYVTSLTRAEYDYIAMPVDLADDSGEPLVPFQYRNLLTAWAAGYVCTDKDDSRAVQLFAEAKARLQAMAKEHRRRTQRPSLHMGQIQPRQGNLVRWRLTGELYQGGYSMSGINIAGLPTNLPSDPGVLWNNGGVLCIS